MLTKEQEEGLEYVASQLNMSVEGYKEMRLGEHGNEGYRALQASRKDVYVSEIPIEVLQPIYEGILAQREALRVAEDMKAVEEEVQQPAEHKEK